MDLKLKLCILTNLAGIFTFGSPRLLPGPRFHHRALGMALRLECLSSVNIRGAEARLSLSLCTWGGVAWASPALPLPRLHLGCLARQS